MMKLEWNASGNKEEPKVENWESLVVESTPKPSGEQHTEDK
jgi:hypothetical protein